ncbi:dihydroxyacetone kinase family protein [Nesterenkonia aerolata]|uniref:Dihydroxyacetone kinase family protein n=1 Tax=Nesterenkonia aerolata TaxID=3074079 RepID=A0ABU2DPN9_9MICC|nr:dihydroxyacetone kinase family protein [Nesterenkonia sp. LY-0111]MDR8018356.1 dihydroxyacetone kinase family protein [Nesterenkonia sp. LY-0111]
MTRLFDDAAQFTEDQLRGFLDLYSDRLLGVDGGVISAAPTPQPQVSVVLGGGSGHYPAFAGLVGPGFAHGAVVGNIFTSPSAGRAYRVARAAEAGRGVIFTFGNYAGDVMNFGLAAQRLAAEGIDARRVIVTDDIASAEQPHRRRGIAGDFTVFKVLGAAAAEGLDLDAVEAAGRHANAMTRTLGVAFEGCTMPGAQQPLFEVPAGHLGLGLGIHGEPGIDDVPMLSAAELAQLLVSRVLAEAPEGAGSRVAPVLNGLGTTKYEELFLLWGHVADLLREAGYQVVQPEVGELVTSLDMGGCSLTLMWLDEDLHRWWTADAYTPAFRRVAAGLPSGTSGRAGVHLAPQETEIPAASTAGRLAGERARGAAADLAVLLEQASTELGRIDAVAGDGDHGRGMLRGITAACAALDELPAHAGIASVLRSAGRTWADDSGGTSGVLWGAALEAAANTLDEQADALSAADAVRAAGAFLESMQSLGGAQPGDKTLIDALVPFLETLTAEADRGSTLESAWSRGAAAAEQAAEATKDLRPAVGRARPLAEKSVGTPDAGATSLAMILRRLTDHLHTDHLHSSTEEDQT